LGNIQKQINISPGEKKNIHQHNLKKRMGNIGSLFDCFNDITLNGMSSLFDREENDYGMCYMLLVLDECTILASQ
jgi:hypothetical protein